MVSYIIGKVISINKKSITLENNYVGYNILVSNVERYEVGKVKKLYIYKSLSINGTKNRIIEEMYGFDIYEEKEMFLKMLNVQGIGNKTAMNLLNNDLHNLKDLIANKDEEGLCGLKNITPKIAHSLIEELELGGEYKSNPNNQTGDLVKALKTLGYTNKEIEAAVANINMKKVELSDLISDAIKYISTSCQMI